MAAARRRRPSPSSTRCPARPLVAERTVDLLRADERVEVTIVPALSFLDLAWAALGHRPAGRGGPAGRRRRTSGRGRAARAVRSWWPSAGRATCSPRSSWPSVTTATCACRGRCCCTISGSRTRSWPRWTGGSSTAPSSPTTSPRSTSPAWRPAAGAAACEVARLVALMDTLRERCPWDRAQTHASLMPHLVEESYEVLDALAALGAAARLRPCGRVRRTWKRSWATCCSRSSSTPGWPTRRGASTWPAWPRRARQAGAPAPARLRRRRGRRPEQVVANWEEIKKDEKGRASVTEGIPAGLPGAGSTSKLARKARAVRRRAATNRASAGRRPDAGRAGRRAAATSAPRRPAVGATRADVASGASASRSSQWRTSRNGSASTRSRRCATGPGFGRDIRAAEGVPEAPVGNR